MNKAGIASFYSRMTPEAFQTPDSGVKLSSPNPQYTKRSRGPASGKVVEEVSVFGKHCIIRLGFASVAGLSKLLANTVDVALLAMARWSSLQPNLFFYDSLACFLASRPAGTAFDCPALVLRNHVQGHVH
jgi:hypothetical protein